MGGCDAVGFRRRRCSMTARQGRVLLRCTTQLRTRNVGLPAWCLHPGTRPRCLPPLPNLLQAPAPLTSPRATPTAPPSGAWCATSSRSPRRSRRRATRPSPSSSTSVSGVAGAVCLCAHSCGQGLPAGWARPTGPTPHPHPPTTSHICTSPATQPQPRAPPCLPDCLRRDALPVRVGAIHCGDTGGGRGHCACDCTCLTCCCCCFAHRARLDSSRHA